MMIYIIQCIMYIIVIHIFTSKRKHGTSKMYSKFLCILLYLNPYYTSYPNLLAIPKPIPYPLLNLFYTVIIRYPLYTLDITVVTAIHKRHPQDFVYSPCPQVSAFCLPLPLGRLASASIRRNLYCVVNFLRDSGHLISHFLDE